MAELFDPVRGTSEPGRLWSITNVSEATPDILSPLCWSVWGRGLEEGVLWSMYSFGVVARREIVMSDDPNDLKTAAIYGRQAFNVDAVRRMVAPMPGVDPNDLERDIMGATREGVPKEPARPWRIPIILVKMPRAMLRTGSELRAVYEDVRQWWHRDVFEASRTGRHTIARPIDRLHEARDRFQRIFGIHCKVRLQLQAVQSALHDAAAKAGDTSLATRAFSGQGNVREVGMAEDLWRLAQGELTEEAFLAEYGFHGPNEGNVYTRSWREEPAPLRSMARSMAARQNYVSPRAREEEAVRAGAQAQAELLKATSALGRPALKFVLARARNIVRNNEIGKAGYLMTLDGCRAAARDLGREEVAGGRLAEVDDVFFLTLEELDRLVEGRLPDASELIAYRRGTREEYKRMKLPSSFEGMPEVTTAERAPSAGPGDEGDQITGAAAGGGQVKGRARVVLDPNDDVELEPGDILVCRFTDPSWAPLFTLAEALVIDLGGAASHGALVAREMGIPYVIGTGDGTARIHDGDQILVDGQHNVVRVIERANRGG
ncbi:phosphoenolpyruvate-utilizing protein [Amycolatopsis sp. K13G38]|uniref:Phosphoenolpyruvate-utilizing protein n=1 Tax=Amycolatopsis acididurans TaxID=2724524 RepID=A0ABX1J764_9PSEU|nr:PEP-utilizing enzyme [Amycolatopsis acididurans]NKQ54260.1 phosphoenolpyruvate-utilizing protein [Amycolatopsis acididurans]